MIYPCRKLARVNLILFISERNHKHRIKMKYFIILLACSLDLVCTIMQDGYNSQVEAHSSIYTKVPYLTNRDWIDHLNTIPIPHREGAINVYFKYKQHIEGYEITMRWQPFERIGCETGVVIINFRQIASGVNSYYVNTEKYNNFHLDMITFSESFQGYRDGDIYYLDYTSCEESPYSQSKLDYFLPFIFFDIDFDGKNELLISDWSKGQSGHEYQVYMLEEGLLQARADIPFSIDNCTDFISKTKSVRTHIVDGCWEEREVFYSVKDERCTRNISTEQIKNETLLSILNGYTTKKGSSFSIDSMHIRLGDKKYRLRVKHNEWICNNSSE